MKTLEYLTKFGLEKLVEEFSIKVSVDERFPNLRVLNYNQIDSPKNHPIVRECRSLVVKEELNGETYSVVSRAFDRFFNQGENDVDHKLEDLTICEKVDGSIISVFYCEPYGWMYRTKSMLMPVLSVQGWDRTWDRLIESALGWSDIDFSIFDKDCTYIFEVVGRENRVVVNYLEDNAYLLAVRDNIDGGYCEIGTTKFSLPRKYSFKTTEDCMKSLKELPNLEEGYVGYENGIPVVKIKSPQYLTAHRLRGEGLTPKRAIEMVVIGELDEYTSVFPEDRQYFDKYVNAWHNLESLCKTQYLNTKDIVDQKEFALNNKVFYSGVMFQSRVTGKEPVKVLHNLETSYKIKLLQTMLEKLDEN